MSGDIEKLKVIFEAHLPGLLDLCQDRDGAAAESDASLTAEALEKFTRAEGALKTGFQKFRDVFNAAGGTGEQLADLIKQKELENYHSPRGYSIRAL
jgi:hypothetical protein